MAIFLIQISKVKEGQYTKIGLVRKKDTFFLGFFGLKNRQDTCRTLEVLPPQQPACPTDDSVDETLPSRKKEGDAVDGSKSIKTT